MTSTEFNVGLGSGSRNSSKVLKPPGGGSSDIFGTGGHTAEPQRKARSHLTSSIFGGEEAQTPARKAGNDSFYNLFGSEPQSQSRPGTAAKDKFRSNIVLDDASTEVKKSLFSETTNGAAADEEVDSGVNGVDKDEETTVHSNGEVETEEAAPAPAATNGEKAEPAVNGSSAPAPAPAPAVAPAPAAPSAAPARRVPPGGFSSGLW